MSAFYMLGHFYHRQNSWYAIVVASHAYEIKVSLTRKEKVIP